MMKNNQKGSVLQIGLIVFIICINFLTCASYFMIQSRNNEKYCYDLIEQNELEILLVKYYYDQMKNDVLISDEYNKNDIHIYYTVDDIGEYYTITTTIHCPRYQYQFEISIDFNTYEIKSFAYIH